VSGANNEHWNLMVVGEGMCRIANVNSALDLEGKVWRTANGSVVDHWQDNDAGSTNDFSRLTQDGNDNEGSTQHWNLIPSQ
jgi:hypothetical protein